MTVRAAETEEIDPYTGEVINKMLASKGASTMVKAGKYTWAYRSGEVDPKEAATAATRPTFLLLHGLGSSSYTFRQVIAYMSGKGYNTIAPDWIGQGDSEKPADFAYSERAYLTELTNFLSAAQVKTPVILVVHGYILGQYGLKWALENADKVEKLVILNTPLTAKAQLAPSLAPYKNPLSFLRPKLGSQFNAMNHNAGGGPYAMELRDAEAFQRPYDADQATSDAVYRVMDKVDFKALCQQIDDEFTT